MTSYQVNTLHFSDLDKSGALVSVLFYLCLFNVTVCLSHRQQIHESVGFLISVTKARHFDLK